MNKVLISDICCFLLSGTVEGFHTKGWSKIFLVIFLTFLLEYCLKSDILEIIKIYKEDLKKIFKRYFFSISHQRPTNGEYIAGEKIFFGQSWRPGEPSEDRPIKHRENTFVSIKIDRAIRFCSTFFLKLGIDAGQEKMYTFDPSATYVSWNPGQKLETKISVSRLGIRQLGN